MAAPTFIGAANAPTSGDTSVASRSVTKPAGAQFAVFFMAAWQTGGGTPDPTAPSGSAQRLKQPTVGGSGETSWVYLKYVDGDATGATYTFTFSSAKFCALKAQFWSGVPAGLTLTSTTDFPGATATAASTTTYPSVAATTTVADSALAWGGNAYDYNSGTATTPAPGFTETGDTVASEMSYRVVSAAGLQTVSGATYGETTNLHSLLVALPGASSGGTTVEGVGTGVFGYTGMAAAVRRVLAVAAGSFGFTGTATGTSTTPPVEGTATGTFGFTGTASGLRRTAGTGSGSFGFTGTAAGVARAVGTGSGLFGYTGTAGGKVTVTGTAAAAFGFAAAALGLRTTHGTASGDFGFTGKADGFSGTPPVQGAATGSFGFAGPAAGHPRIVSSAAGDFGFTGAVAGKVQVIAIAASSFGFDATATSVRTILAAAAAAFGFTATADGGLPPPPYTAPDEVTITVRSYLSTAVQRDHSPDATARPYISTATARSIE